VLGIDNATELLNDGDLIEVDESRGIAEVTEQGSARQPVAPDSSPLSLSNAGEQNRLMARMKE